MTLVREREATAARCVEMISQFFHAHKVQNQRKKIALRARVFRIGHWRGSHFHDSVAFTRLTFYLTKGE